MQLIIIVNLCSLYYDVFVSCLNVERVLEFVNPMNLSSEPKSVLKLSGSHTEYVLNISNIKLRKLILSFNVTYYIFIKL